MTAEVRSATRRQYRDFFALKRNLVVLLVATFLIGAGEELWMRFVPKYLEALGAAVFIIGLFDALRTLLGAVYAYPGGLLADAWGHRRALITFNLLSIVGYAVVLLVPHWSAVIGGMFLFLSWSCFSLPATFSLIGATLAANRYAMGVAVQSVTKRLPIMIAPIAGGLLIDRFGVVNGVRIALSASILLSTATILLQTRIGDDHPQHDVSSERWNFWQSLRGLGHDLRHLLVSDILVRFCERIPFAWVVIYAMDHIGVSGTEVGVLTTVEVLVASLCIIPASHFADKLGREPFVVITFIMFTLFPLSLWLASGFGMLVLAFAIRGLKEFGDASRKALIISYCEERRRGQLIGAYYLSRDLIVSFGALVGAALWKFGPATNFVGATVCGIAGTLFYVSSLRRKRDRLAE